ncbi:MAG TPA: hypothetical protein VK572_00955 [Burkholderiales bacterium]|nr:hypothetical protein [Burkholderiales bacterium]
MTEALKKDTQDKEAVNGKPAAKQAGIVNKQMGIRLTPVENSDQPVVANYCSINVSPGMAFIDFGFLEPGMLAALPRMAKSGGKMPEQLNGKLAVRVALGFDALANLHQRLGGVLTGLSQVHAAGAKKQA